MTPGGSLAKPIPGLRARLILYLAVLAVLVGMLLAASLGDPHGLAAAPAVTPSDAPRLQPLYGASGTGTRTLDWSPDGRFIAVGGRDSPVVEVLDARTGGVAATLTPPSALRPSGLLDATSVWVVRWSPDGTRIAVGGGEGFPGPGWVWIFDPHGDLLEDWEAHPVLVIGLSWSPDSQRIATAGGSAAAVWDAASGRQLWYVANASAGDGADWSPDGAVIAYGRGTFRDAGTGEELAANCSGAFDASLVAWSHDGSRLALAGPAAHLAICTREGTILGDWILGPDQSGPHWGRPSWDPSDTMVAVGVSDGIHLVRADTGSAVRVLSFPVGGYGFEYFLETRGPGTSQDEDVAWAPGGNAIASIGTMSAPSLRLWGIERGSTAWWGIGVEAVAAAGLPLVLGREFASLVLGFGGRSRTGGRISLDLAFGAPFLEFAFVAALLQSMSVEALSRSFGAQVIPDPGWWLLTFLVSGGLGVVAVLFTVFVFRGLGWRAAQGRPSPSLRAAGRFLGLGLIPLLWLTSLGTLGVLALASAGVAVGPPLWGTAAVIAGGAGLLLGGLATSRANGESLQRTVGSLLASAVIALLVTVGVTMAALTVLGAGLGMVPGLSIPGFTVLVGFGWMPLVFAAAFLAVTGSSVVLLAYPPRGLLFLYTRLTRQEVLDLATRRRILRYLGDHPGVHFRGLLRDLGVGSGSLSYHLYVLEREGFVVPRRDGMYRRFFLAGSATP